MRAVRHALRSVADWWSDLRYQYPDRLAAAGILGAVVLGFGGYVSVSALGGGSSAADAHGPVTTTYEASPSTIVPAPRSGETSPARAQRPQTVYRQQVVLLHGKSVTVRRIVTDPRTATVVQTVGSSRTVIHGVSAPARTVTVVGPAATVTRPAATVTEPGTTVTGPGTTVTRTTVVTSTVTVTEPAITVTVTLPLP